MLNPMRRILSAAAAGLGVVLFVQSVWAQTQPASLEEIVVTARRRAESLLNVPVSVTALSRETLERSHITDIQQIAAMTPNLMIASASGGGGGSISIRGVGSSYLDPGIEQSVGINIDSVSVGRGRFILASQFDLQQVEVLKGPQALFFGKNSPAGVVSITTADPTNKLSAMLRAGYEFEAREKFVEGYVSGPLTDNLGFRVAGKFSDLRGFIKNVTQAAPNLASPGFDITGPNHRWQGQTSYAGRLTLKWQPTDRLTGTFKFAVSHLTGDGDESNTEAFCSRSSASYPNLSILSFTQGMVIDPQSDCKKNRRKAVGAIPAGFLVNWPEAQKHNGNSWNILDTYLGSLNLNYRLSDALTLTSVTGYTKLLGKNLGDYDNTSFATVWSAQRESTRTWSQELRLASDYKGPLNFTLGLFFEDAKRSNSFNPILGFIGFDPTNGGSAYTFRDIWRNSGKTYSAYGQVRWSILDNLELAGGVRYTKEKKSIAGENSYINGLGLAFGFAPAGQVVARKLQFSNWSPEVTLSYKPQRNLMIYLAYKTGYKSGGLSTPATISTAYVADPSLLAFKPEKSKGFEAGIKGELFDRTLRFDLAVYRYTFTDLQLTSFDPDLVAYFIRNAGKARTTGIEGSVVWRATQELNLTAGAAYNRAKYVSFTVAQCPATMGCQSYDRSGQPLPRAPKFSFNAGFDYSHAISDGLKIGVNGEGIWTSSYWTSEVGDTAGILKGFWRLNAGVRIGATDDRWELALIGRNLTNKYYMLVSNDKVLSVPGNYGGYFARPREVVVQGTVKF